MSERFLFHVVRREELVWGADERYQARSLEAEGFAHASFRDCVLESARLYFPANAELRVLAIDPRLLDVRVEVVETPRGPMPHIHGPIPRAAVTELALGDVGAHADALADVLPGR